MIRFWSKVDKSGEGQGCWEWTAYKSPEGYGRSRLGKKRLAHRIAYELLVGPVPEGLQLDHLCRNRSCVNPAHLEPVTSRENTARGITLAAAQSALTHCVRGHGFGGDNLQYRANGRARTCRMCAGIRMDKFLSKNRVLVNALERARRATARAAWLLEDVQ